MVRVYQLVNLSTSQMYKLLVNIFLVGVEKDVQVRVRDALPHEMMVSLVINIYKFQVKVLDKLFDQRNSHCVGTTCISISTQKYHWVLVLLDQFIKKNS